MNDLLKSHNSKKKDRFIKECNWNVNKNILKGSVKESMTNSSRDIDSIVSYITRRLDAYVICGEQKIYRNI